MDQTEPAASLLPLPLPDERNDRVVLVMMRRMAGHGLHDASAAMLAFNEFGIDFRRPLVLLRGFMAELAETSQRQIQLAPCCAMRMTQDEGRLLESLALAHGRSARAAENLRALSGSSSIGQALSTAFAFNASMADLGRPLAG